MKTTFYIIRHGKTVFNQMRRFQGWCDSPLAEEGIQMAKELNKELKDIHFDLAASSTSERAIDTLNFAIEGKDVKRVYSKNLREMSFGKLEGALIDYGTPPREIEEIGYGYCGGENRMDAGMRFVNALKEIAIEGNVVVASHGAVIFTLLQMIDPSIEFGHINHLVPNCSVAIVEYENETFKIVEMPTTKLRKD